MTKLFRFKPIQFLYPKTCIFCYEMLTDYTFHKCELCYNKYRFIEENRCQRCGKPMSRPGLCFDCQQNRTLYKQGVSMFPYEDRIKQSLIDLKFHNKTWIGRSYGGLMAEFYIQQLKTGQLDWDIDTVTVVPLHYLRFLSRGYNQSGLIGEYFIKSLSKHNLSSQPVYKHNLLMRSRYTKFQKQLGQQKRFDNLKQTFSVNIPYRTNKYIQRYIKDKNILLIDDIHTTGATLNSCASVLYGHGAKEVYCLTVAIGYGL